MDKEGREPGFDLRRRRPIRMRRLSSSVISRSPSPKTSTVASPRSLSPSPTVYPSFASFFAKNAGPFLFPNATQGTCHGLRFREGSLISVSPVSEISIGVSKDFAG